jgi:hypothetical protein
MPLSVFLNMKKILDTCTKSKYFQGEETSIWEDILHTQREYTDGINNLLVTIEKSLDGELIYRQICWNTTLDNGNHIESRLKGPCMVTYHARTKTVIINYTVRGFTHRADGPASITIGKGVKDSSWCLEGNQIDQKHVKTIQRALEDEVFAAEVIADNLLKYPASVCLGSEVYPDP